MKRILRWIILGFIGSLALLIAGSFVSHRLHLSREAGAFPPPGQLVDVGGYRLHIHCIGAGEPTVVLEGGTGEWSTYWRPIQPGLAQTVRVCAYDRAGMGWSDEAPPDIPRTAQQIASELDVLLREAGIPGPYVLAAHSAGGLYSRAFAHQFPQAVAGLVMIDASHESLFAPLPELLSSSQGLFRLCANLLAPLGIVRATGLLPPEWQALPATEQAVARALGSRPQFCATAERETAAFERSAQTLLDAGPLRLGETPLLVITARIREADDWPDDATWYGVHQQMLAESERSTHMIAESGHYVQLEQPETIVQAILDLLTEAR